MRASALVRVIAGTSLAVLVASLPVASASAASTPPVTAPDDYSVYVGEIVDLHVLANDSDADGDDLAVCRVSGTTSGFIAEPAGDTIDFALFADPHGPITFTYYACDFDTLVPATVTIHTKTVHKVGVRKHRRPGLLMVTNPNDAPIEFLYGSSRAESPDGQVRIPAGKSRKVRVHRKSLVWVAYIGSGGAAGRGRVSHIKLPKGDKGPTKAGRIDATTTRVWRSAS